MREHIPLSLQRSTINVENVGVRLWQSSAICLRAFARSTFLFTGSPRFARDDNGDQVCFLEISNHPALRAPLQWRGTGSATGRKPSSPLRRGVDVVDGVVTIIENNIPERHHTRMPTATTGPRANIVCVGGSVGGGCRAKRDGGWEYIIPRARARTTTAPYSMAHASVYSYVPVASV